MVYETEKDMTKSHHHIQEHHNGYPFPDITGHPDLEPFVTRTQDVVEAARQFAFEDRNFGEAAKVRVESALNTFGQYTLEAEIIASGLRSPEYVQFVGEVTEYLQNTRVGFIACPDGRVNPIAFGNPRVGSMYRKLAGVLRVQMSFRTHEPVSVNPTIKASIHSGIRRQIEQGYEGFLFEGMGPHINSSDPAHGCGAAIAELTGTGHGLPPTPESLWDGGVVNYFTRAEQTQAFEALNNVARLAGGNGVTVDLTHDTRSQGLIFGLRAHYRELDESAGLRASLLKLAQKGKIIMTEQLADQFRDHIHAIASEIDPTFDPRHPRDFRNFLQYTSNAMLIGRVALELARTSEHENFSFIPQHLTKDMPEKAVRALAYTLLRNAAFQVIAGIEPDNHTLVHHPERVMRAGTIGADFNVNMIPFILGTADVMTETDFNDALALYGLMARFLPELGVNLEKEARVVMVTGAFNPDIYRSPEDATVAREQVMMSLYHNSGQLRDRLKEAVDRGYVLILPVVHHPVTRSLEIANL